MRNLILVLCLLIFSSFSYAAGGGEGGMRWSLRGYYGLASISPGDLNTIEKNGGLPTFSSDTLFGGGLGYMINPKWELVGEFELQSAKATTTFVGTTVGMEASQNEIWAILNYFLIHSNNVHVYVGAGGGYPTYSHLKIDSITNIDLDADKSIGFLGQVGLKLGLGRLFSLFVEGGYQMITATNLKNSAGGALQVTTGGANAKMDLSGARGEAGLALNF